MSTPIISCSTTYTAVDDDIATAALEHYDQVLPLHKGKPRATDEWTVYAAIVVTTTTTTQNHHCKPRVLACATGTKCTAVHTMDKVAQDVVLHDSHAEVLTKRGAQRVLWAEIQRHEQQKKVGKSEKGRDEEDSHTTEDTDLLEPVPNPPDNSKSNYYYRVKPHIQFHLYVSDSPCGDASIYPLSADNEMKTTAQFTGAKIIVNEATQVSLTDCGVSSCLDRDDGNDTKSGGVAREAGVHQLLSCLRTKSGRSNLDAHRRSQSLSCSDKIVRWCVLGWQGRALLQYLEVPLHLTSIVVSRDPRCVSATQAQADALQRAITHRVQVVRSTLESNRQDNDDNGWLYNDSPDHVTTVQVVQRVFAQGKAVSDFSSSAQQPQLQHQQNPSRKRKHMSTDPQEEQNDGDDGDHSHQGQPSQKTPSKKMSPAGVSLNWNVYDGSVEVTVGARGLLQGKKPRTLSDQQKLASRLSRYAIGEQWISQSYAAVKANVTRQSSVRQIVFRKGPLAGWKVYETSVSYAEEQGKQRDSPQPRESNNDLVVFSCTQPTG